MLEMTRDDGVAIVRMNDPEGRNAFSIPMRLALLQAFRELEADTAVRAIVFGGGEKYFSVGGDIKDQGARPMQEALNRMRVLHDLVRLMAQSSKPRVCAVEGWAVGGGLALALLCDTIVAGDSARFKAGFGEIGLAPDTGILHTLPERVGRARARQILLYNETVAAAQALHWGLIDHVVPSGCAEAEARRLAHDLAKKPPLPIALTRSVFASGLDDVLLREREIQVMLWNSADHAEGRVAFLEKRAGVFRGE
ncbi:enoyl-CoA hydratase/isomerase family protein [Achromobacter aegrifaciens]